LFGVEEYFWTTSPHVTHVAGSRLRGGDPSADVPPAAGRRSTCHRDWARSSSPTLMTLTDLVDSSAEVVLFLADLA